MHHLTMGERKPYFVGVAIATLLSGASIVAIALAEFAANMWFDGSHSDLMLKLIGGLVVTSLGYIHLELEWMRLK